jgi:beta-lactamase superfamily II metal-dependent hydrolase
MRKRLRRSLKAVTEWCREHRHDPVDQQQEALNRKLRGHYQYYGRSTNFRSLLEFYERVRKIWQKWLNRRSRGATRKSSPGTEGRRDSVNWVRAVLITALFLATTPANGQDLLRVHFFDVGQGDAVLIQSPSGQSAVYDGGRNSGSLLAELNRLGVSRIDLVIASHNHADHITGLAAVLERFRPRFYMDNGIPATTLTYQRLLEAVRSAGSQLLEPTARRISFGDLVIQVR